MSRLAITLCLLLTFTAALYAKDAPPRPLSQAMLDAKTIYIDNRSGNEKLFNRATTELTNWGHYTLITDQAKADLTLIISTESAGMNDENDALAVITLQIFIPHDDIPQFSFSQTDQVRLLERDVSAAIKMLHKRFDSSGKTK